MIKFLRSSPSLSLPSLGNYYRFANESPKRKIQTVGFSNNHIENVKSLGYKLKQPLKFINGKFLIYKSKPSLLRTLSDYLLHIVGVSIFGYLIYSRHNIDVYPVVFHAYVGGIAIFLFFFMRKFLKNQNIVKEIFLLEGGKATQIVFQNQLKRKLFREPLQNTYYNSLFVPPKENEDQFKILHEFPKDLEALDMSSQFGKYWKKYYSNQGNFLLIPQSHDFIHKQILSQVMNGKVIIC